MKLLMLKTTCGSIIHKGKVLGVAQDSEYAPDSRKEETTS